MRITSCYHCITFCGINLPHSDIFLKMRTSADVSRREIMKKQCIADCVALGRRRSIPGSIQPPGMRCPLSEINKLLRALPFPTAFSGASRPLQILRSTESGARGTHGKPALAARIEAAQKCRRRTGQQAEEQTQQTQQRQKSQTRSGKNEPSDRANDPRHDTGGKSADRSAVEEKTKPGAEQNKPPDMSRQQMEHRHAQRSGGNEREQHIRNK